MDDCLLWQLGYFFLLVYVAEVGVKIFALRGGRFFGLEGFLGNAQPHRFIYVSDFVRAPVVSLSFFATSIDVHPAGSA